MILTVVFLAIGGYMVSEMAWIDESFAATSGNPLRLTTLYVGGPSATDANLIVDIGSASIANMEFARRVTGENQINESFTVSGAGDYDFNFQCWDDSASSYLTSWSIISDDHATDFCEMSYTRDVNINSGASLVIGGSVIAAPVTVTTTPVALLTDTHYIVLVDDDTVGGAATLTLPAAASNTGTVLYIKKLGTTGSVTVDGNSAETIDGAATQVLSTQYEVIQIVCDGTEWWII